MKRRVLSGAAAAVLAATVLSGCGDDTATADRFAELRSSVYLEGFPDEAPEEYDLARFAHSRTEILTGTGEIDYRVPREMYQPDMVIGVRGACTGDGSLQIRIAQTENTGEIGCHGPAGVTSLWWDARDLPTDEGFAITFRAAPETDVVVQLVMYEINLEE